MHPGNALISQPSPFSFLLNLFFSCMRAWLLNNDFPLKTSARLGKSQRGVNGLDVTFSSQECKSVVAGCLFVGFSSEF